MRNFKRFLTLALAVLMVVSVFTFSTSAATFTDVDADDEYLAKAVNLLSYLGITKGTSETTFGTDELVTREQMAAFIYRFMKKGKSVEGGANTSTFADLEDPTFFFMISWANSEGIIKGTSDTTFNPKGSITLQDAYTMIVRALGYETEQTLPYPFGYIGVAEDKGVELDEGLSSEVTYTTPLTRGDVAVILYNAFFAETGVAETKQVEAYIGDEEKGNWVLKTETVYPTFCEKYFDVVEVEYQVVATPSYTFGAYDATKSFGYDAVQFKEVDGEDVFYYDFADLGLAGEADDYIMAHVKMYVTLDKEDNIDEILYAESLMDKKTVKEIGFETLSTNTKASYTVEGDIESAKHLSGKVTLDGEVAYFFNAPYSYAKPNYTKLNADTDVKKYNARNDENLELIELALKAGKDDEYVYSVANSFKAYGNEASNVEFAEIVDKCYSDMSIDVMKALKQAFVGGLYSADVYDVDGDGNYDYMLYKPYTFAIADTDEDEEFDGQPDANNVLFTNEATIVGELEDEDAFIGWINAEANLIEVAAVVESFEATVENLNEETGVLTLSNGKTVSAKDGWKLVTNYIDDVDLKDIKYVVEDADWTEFADLTSTSVYDNDGIEFWIYDDVVLLQKGVTTTVTYDGDLIIVTPDKNGDVIKDSAWSVEAGVQTYVNVWVNGEVKYVPVETEADVEYPLTSDNIDKYVGKLATYKVDKDGLYTITPIADFKDDNGDELGLPAIGSVDFTDKEDEKLQGQYAAGEATAKLNKLPGGRFQLMSGSTKLGDVDLIVDANTVIIVKNVYTSGSKTKIDYVELNVEKLTNSVEQTLTNVQFILANNTGRYADTAEKLVVLYAETVEDEKLSIKGETVKKADRIISRIDLIKNTDGEFVYKYKVINPYTGENEEFFGTHTEEKAADAASPYALGDVVKVEAGQIEDADAEAKISNVSSATANLYWVLDMYDNGELLIAEVGSDLSAQYRIDVDEATVLMIGRQVQSGENMYRYANGHVVGTLDALADNVYGDATNYKAVSASYWDGEDANAKLVKAYGKYVKVYLNIDWENSDKTPNEDGVNGEAAYIVAVANNNEDKALCDTENAVKA